MLALVGLLALFNETDEPIGAGVPTQPVTGPPVDQEPPPGSTSGSNVFALAALIGSLAAMLSSIAAMITAYVGLMGVRKAESTLRPKPR